MISIKRLCLRLLFSAILLFTLNSLSIADEAVYRKLLENGLVILAKESPQKDLVAINITIKTGLSSEEEYTASGISHLVEHLVFKGTSSRKMGDIEKEIRSYGGSINGAVSYDTTIYEVIVPIKYFAQAVSVLKDMLTNSTFDKNELEKERKVILNEIRLNKDDPEKKLLADLFKNSYTTHSYRYPPIGYEKSLESLTRDDVMRYYNRRYVPNNMVISVVGGINAKEATQAIEREFSRFREASYRPVNKSDKEPPQVGKRSIEENAAIGLSYLALGFHSTGILNKDLFALDVLSMILGRGDNSRLNKTLLKEKREVHSISAWNYTPMDPGLFVITAILDKESIPIVKKDILDEIKKIKDGEISHDEIETAKRMVVSDKIMSGETIEDQARDLSESEILTGNSDFYSRYVDGVKKVSKYDIKRVAAQYLNENNLTEVSMVPKDIETLPSVSIPKPRNEYDFSKTTLPNGLILLTRKNTNIPAVSITIAFSGGLDVENKKNNGISNLTARMLLGGTKTRKESDIAGAIETRGGSISSFSGFNSFGLNITVLRDDLDFALELIKDITSNSVFPQDELTKEKMLSFATIKDQDNDIFEAGALNTRKLLFNNYPYGMRDIGEEDSVKALDRDELMKFYQSRCIPNNMVISISGDIDPDKVRDKVSILFKDVERRDLIRPLKNVYEGSASGKNVLKMDKEQALIMLGFKTFPISNPDRYTINVLSGLLSGTSGRLFNSLRDKAALTYVTGSIQKLGVNSGFILFYAATTADKINDAKKLIIDEISAVKKGLITDDEIEAAKKEIISSQKTQMQTNAANSFKAALDELYGLGYDNMYKFENETNKVTKYDIIRVAGKYLNMDSCAEVIIKPQ